MSDRRFARMAEGIAHLDAPAPGSAQRVPGDWRQVRAPLVDLWVTPGGARDRQLLAGTRFCVLTGRESWSYGFDGDDGYCGWVHTGALGAPVTPTHWVTATASHAFPAPDIKHPGAHGLPHGARLAVGGVEGRFCETDQGFVPTAHLRRLGEWSVDPVGVARQFLGAPYLWGGNSAAGIDCSGLVQAAFRACGRACPPDGDLQMRMLGVDVAPGREQAGDLVFWAGHVALISATGRVIHANATHMAVVEEDLSAVEARAEGPVLRRLRPTAGLTTAPVSGP